MGNRLSQRLRPYPNPAELATMYATPHDHTQFADHITRVDTTIALGIALAGRLFGDDRHIAIADLSCGNAAIAEGIRRQGDSLLLGDFAPGYLYTGKIEQTARHLPQVDMFVCCETLEHVDDPLAVLRLIRPRTGSLLLSTPVENWDDGNLEHVWSWSREGVEDHLFHARFDVLDYAEVDGRPQGGYLWGIWSCE